jgi:hypothetical protein
MKKSLSILVLLITISSVGFARISNTPTFGVGILQNGSTVKLLYRGEQSNDVKVIIFNAENKIVLSEKFKNVDGFLRPYNFADLPNGNYRFELIDANGSQIESIDYREGSEARIAKLMPVSGNDKKLLLSVPNKKIDVLTITILDEANNVLYSENEKITGDFAKVYNLESVKGKIRFNVVDRRGHAASLVH